MTNLFSDNWIAPDGWHVRRAQLTAAGSAEPRGSLLFLNGRGDHIEKYAEALEEWAGMGWRTESFDWRGQGGSGRFTQDGLLGHVDDFGCWLDDLEAYAREWHRSGPEPHVIVAHSMGGHLLLRALAERRVQADAAVLVAPMLGISAGKLPRRLAGGITSAACKLGLTRTPVWPHSRISEDSLSVVQTTLTHSKPRFQQELDMRRTRPDLVMSAPSWGWLKAAYQSIDRLEQPGTLEHIRTPLLMIATTADRLVCADAIRRMSRRIEGAAVHFYGDECAHEILREVDAVREDAMGRIEHFLAETAPAARLQEISA